MKTKNDNIFADNSPKNKNKFRKFEISQEDLDDDILSSKNKFSFKKFGSKEINDTRDWID